MFSIAVCDDEVIECCNMAKRIKEIMAEMKIPCIIRQFRSGGELLRALESFDIVFLDIIMQDLDGMKTAQIFREKAPDKILIFVSSSREYVFEAYDVEAFQYLVKPVGDRKLKSVLQRAVLKTKSRSQEFIIVSRERQKKKLFLDDIYYFEIKGRMVYAHVAEGIFTYYEQIGELEDKLQDYGFFRCHKSYLINLKYVDGYIKLVSAFVVSLLSCLVLFFLHTVKKIPEPLLGDWGGGLVSGAGCCFAISAIYWLSKHLEPVFCGRRGKWYVILAVPLLVNAAVYEAASLGASNGIMVRSAGSMGLYYDQIFSHSEFLVLALLSMAAAGFYVFGMNRIYLEQEKNGRYHSQIAVYKMLAEQYRQSERLRHDMKNHIIVLYS